MEILFQIRDLDVFAKVYWSNFIGQLLAV
jgi:hypothetical protein